MVDKNVLEEILKIAGEVRGVVFQTDASYVLRKEGQAGLKKLEEQAKLLNLPINYRETSSFKAYPIGLRVASLLLMKDTFNWDDAEIRKLGYEAPKTSFIVKLLMKFLASFLKLMDEVPKYWQEHYNIGSLEATNVDDVKKEATIYLKGIKIHPIFCLYLEGYFEKIYEFSLEGKKGNCKETECMFKGAPCHRYDVSIKK
jgi:hypothetical protein